MSDHYIGVMSGTSFDSVDCVMVRLKQGALKIIHHVEVVMPSDIQTLLKTLSQASPHDLNDLYTLDARLGDLYAQAINRLLEATKMAPHEVRAIGLHGQTLRHFPNNPIPYTTQIGDPNRVVAGTGITTVCDFRRGDIARGGQGAPLAPAFHRAFFHDPHENRIVLNIGGFSNITLLPQSGKVAGFDTGPGNVLIDAFMQTRYQQSYDAEGQLAATGQVDEPLLATLLAHPFFAKPAPKSTGRDEFNLAHIEQVLKSCALPNASILATLSELTARSIVDAIKQVQPHTEGVFVCGGGVYNTHLMSRLAALMPEATWQSTEALGIEPKLVEACLMAWLGQQTMDHASLELRDITGSHSSGILGGVYYAPATR